MTSCKSDKESFLENELNNQMVFNSNLISELEGFRINKYEEFMNQSRDWFIKYNEIDTNSFELINFIDSAIILSQKNPNVKLDASVIRQHYRAYVLNNHNIIIDSNVSPNRIESMKMDLSKIEFLDTSRFYSFLNNINGFQSNDSINLKLLKSHLVQSKYMYKDYIMANSHLYRCGYYERYAAIAVCDKTVYLKNEMIEINAGVGYFNDISLQSIKILDKFVPTKDGMAVTKINAPNKVGSFNIPILIKYIGSYGEVKTETKNLNFKVVDTICN